MSPSDYKACYLKLKVPVVIGDKLVRWEDVELSRYVLVVGHRQRRRGRHLGLGTHPDNQAAHDALLGKLKDLFAAKGATLTVHVKPVDGAASNTPSSTPGGNSGTTPGEAVFREGEPGRSPGHPPARRPVRPAQGRHDAGRTARSTWAWTATGSWATTWSTAAAAAIGSRRRPMGTDCLATKTIGAMMLRANGAQGRRPRRPTAVEFLPAGPGRE